MTEPETTTAAAAAAAAAVASSRNHEQQKHLQEQDNPITTTTTNNNNNNNNPILSFFLNIFQLLPLPKKQPEPTKAQTVKVKPIIKEEIIDEPKPTVVSFPKQVEPELPSLKLEAEDTDTNTNPVLLWQVYAIGGFFILKWAWTRWNERKGKKKPSDEEPPPPGQE